jgi:hypothetical protein
MPLKLTLLAIQKSPFGPYIDVEFQVTPSGSYPAGGDTMDLTTLYNQVDPAGRSIDSDQLPVWMEAASLGAWTGNSGPNYEARTYTNTADGVAALPLTPATTKLQAFLGVTEEAAGAYDNKFLSDFIVVKATFKSQQ